MYSSLLQALKSLEQTVELVPLVSVVLTAHRFVLTCYFFLLFVGGTERV